MLKQLRIDYDLYQQELAAANKAGRKEIEDKFAKLVNHIEQLVASPSDYDTTSKYTMVNELKKVLEQACR